MELVGDYLLFLLEVITVVAVIALAAAGLARGLRRDEPFRGRLRVRSLNRHIRALSEAIESRSAPGVRRPLPWRRTRTEEPRRRRIFVLGFNGDLRASAVANLREEVTAVLAAAREGDEVLLRIDSLGGIVAGYGLAASQVARIRDRGLPLTVCIDRAAASGGYMMACVADRVFAAPFAIVGSIGVVAQLPNFHRLLKRHDVDYEQFHAGPYKRTVTLFGENTEEDRDKMREQVEEAYRLFREFVARYRPQLDLDRVATGEYWYGSRAVEMGLVDELRTSDDLLLEASRDAELLELHYATPRTRRWLPA